MTNLILGPPGTGKTTYLISKLTEISKDVPLEKIAYISFTKAAINSAKEKINESDRKQCKYFRTLHSLCFMLLRMNTSKMLSKRQKKEFENLMKGEGLDVSVDMDENIEPKNLPLYIYHMALNKDVSIKQAHNDLNLDVSLEETEYIIESYIKYKKKLQVKDFNDLLVEIKESNTILDNVQVLFLDEAQDNTLLQWQVINSLFKNVDRVYIAGDDDQQIFSFNGADLKSFLSLKFDTKKILNKSYRLPKTVLDFSKTIVNQIPEAERFVKEFEHREELGSVKEIISLEEIKDQIISTLKSGESWFFLVRNIYLSKEFSTFLTDNGIPFFNYSKPSIAPQDKDAIFMYERWRKGAEKLTSQSELVLSMYLDTYNVNLPWFNAFVHMDDTTKVYYRRILANGFMLNKEIKARVSTIHRVKGEEADNVVILPDMSYSTYEMGADNSNEHRVYYVAATRAKNNLFILEPQTNLYYKGVTNER